MNTDVTGADLELLVEQLSGLREKVQDLEEETKDLKEKQHFRFSSIVHDNSVVRFYTRFETLDGMLQLSWTSCQQVELLGKFQYKC